MSFDTSYLSLIVLVSLYSCERTINIQYPTVDQEYVSYCFVTNDSTESFLLELYKSASVSNFDGSFIKINNAKVSMIKDTSIIPFNPSFDGKYWSLPYQFFGVNLNPNDKFNISIQVDDSLINGYTYIPEKAIISSFSLDDSTSSSYTLTVQIEDPQHSSNYYIMTVYSVGSSNILKKHTFRTNDPAIEKITNELVTTNEEYFSQGFLTDQSFNGQKKEINFQLSKNHNNKNKIIIQIQSVSVDYYNFYRSVEIQKQSLNNPFSTPVNLYSNLNGGLGVFAGYANPTLDTVKL